MSDDDFVEEIEDKISKIPNFPVESVKKLLKVYSTTNNSNRKNKLKIRIERIVNIAWTRHKQSKNPILTFPSKEEAGEGFLEIGNVMAGDTKLYPFTLTAETLRQHIFCTAYSGFGKTVLLFNIVDSLIRANVKFIAFDFKRDFRSLVKKYPQIIVIRWNQIRFNQITNVPEGCDPKEWTRTLFSILAHSQSLFLATPSHIMQSLDDMYERKDGAITFQDLLEFLESNIDKSKKNLEYADVAINRIYNLVSILGDVLNVKHGWPIKDLFNRQIVIEMDGLDYPSVAFLSQTLLFHEFTRRLKNQIRNNRQGAFNKWFIRNHVEILMPESHNLQYVGNEKSLTAIEHSDSPLSLFFSEARELGLGVFAESQYPHKVMESFKINASTKIIGGITESNFQKELADSIGLDKDQYKILGSLKKSNWIYCEASRTKPFVLNTPIFDKGDLVADAEILEGSSPFINEMTIRQQALESKMFLTHLEKKSENANLPQLSKDSWLLLEHIFQNHFAYQSEIKDSLQLAYRRIMKAKEELQKKRLIVEKKFPVIVNDRIHFAITPEGLEVMKTIGKTNQQIGFWKKICGKPGYQHHYWVFTLWGLHKKLGWKGRDEYVFPNGRRVDLHLVNGDYVKVIEYENSTIDVENKVRVLDDVSELVLLYKNESELKLARAKLEKIEGLRGKLWMGLDVDYLALLRDILKASEKGRNTQSEENPSHSEPEKRRDSGESKD